MPEETKKDLGYRIGIARQKPGVPITQEQIGIVKVNDAGIPTHEYTWDEIFTLLSQQEDARLFMSSMPNPTAEEQKDPLFLAIFDVIKSWDVNVPNWYRGYCGANGSHAVAILRAIEQVLQNDLPEDDQLSRPQHDLIRSRIADVVQNLVATKDQVTGQQTLKWKSGGVYHEYVLSWQQGSEKHPNIRKEQSAE